MFLRDIDIFVGAEGKDMLDKLVAKKIESRNKVIEVQRTSPFKHR